MSPFLFIGPGHDRCSIGLKHLTAYRPVPEQVQFPEGTLSLLPKTHGLALIFAMALPLAVPANEVEVGDGTIGYADSANWTPSVSSGFRGNQSLVTTKGTGQPALDQLYYNDGTNGGQLKYVAWYAKPFMAYNEFTTVEVYAWWVAGSNRAKDAKYNVIHADGASTIQVDQTQNGSRWNYLGTFRMHRPFDENPYFTLPPNQVRLYNNFTQGDVISADGVRFVFRGEGNSVIVDQGGPGYLESGSWSSQTGTANWGGSARFANPAPGTVSDASWALPPSPSDQYDVFLWWAAGTQNTSQANLTIQHQGGLSNFPINQRGASAGWESIGLFSMGGPGATHFVYLPNTADGRVVADAVKYVGRNTRMPLVADNDLPGFTASAQWTKSRAMGRFYHTTYATRATGSISDAATWTWPVPQSGQYRVEARWVASSNRAPAAPYRITHSSGTSTVQVNQQVNGDKWNVLGTYSFASGQATVQLSCWTTAGFVVCADAVRLVPIN